MDAPVVTPAVLAAAHLHEAVVDGQVVADAVPPAGAAGLQVGEPLLHRSVDGGQVEFLRGGGQDDFGNQGDVGERGLGVELGLRL